MSGTNRWRIFLKGEMGPKLGLRRRVEFGEAELRKRASEGTTQSFMANAMGGGRLDVLLPRAEVWLMVGSLVPSSAPFLRQVCDGKPASREYGRQTFLESPGEKHLGDTKGSRREKKP